MKFGLRTPSFKRRFAARTSLKRVVRHNLGLKAPRGFGILTNPKKAIYNKVYNKTSVSLDRLLTTGNKKSSDIITNSKHSNNSFLINVAIFVVLSVIYFPLAIVFVVYKVYKSRKTKTHEVSTGGNVTNDTLIKNNQRALVGQFRIPEPTKSLLWITDEDTSKISSPMSIRISLDIANNKAEIDDGHNFFGEPSLIWQRLPIKYNTSLEEKPMYYPSYSGLSPEHRFQYLSWLQDVTQPTNLSYIFLYYYGLERHMLVGDYENAVKEILRLLQFHQKGSFKGYATTALIAASAFRRKPEIVTQAPFLLEEPSNESLILKKMAGKKLTSVDVMGLTYQAGFRNKRYIKLYPELFKSQLQKNIDNFESVHGDILSTFEIKELSKIERNVFANMSLPNNVRAIKVPDLVGSEDFCNILFQLLDKTHGDIKELKTKK